jgi:hypothetical protein
MDFSRDFPVRRRRGTDWGVLTHGHTWTRENRRAYRGLRASQGARVIEKQMLDEAFADSDCTDVSRRQR